MQNKTVQTGSLYMFVKVSDCLIQVKHFLSCYCTHDVGASFHLSYCRKLCQCTSVQRCFSSCHTIAFQRICTLWGLSRSNWDFQSSSTGLMRSCCRFKAFFCHDEEEKKVPYLNPPSLSYVQGSICMSRSHVIISFCSSWCPRVVPLLLGVLLSSNCAAHLTSHGFIWKSCNIYNLETQQIYFSCRNSLKMLLLWHTVSMCQTGREILTSGVLRQNHTQTVTQMQNMFN